MKTTTRLASLGAVLGLVLMSPLMAQELISNGGFESGFNGWTRVDQVGSEGTWSQQTGTASPVNGFTVPAPPAGSSAAMTDAQGPGSHILYQDFVVPVTLTTAALQLQLYVNNHAVDFFSPTTLDFSTTALNQQFRIDIVTTSADPFSLAPADVLLNIFQTQPGNPLVSGYNTIFSDLTLLFSTHPGETLRLRLAEVDNVNFLDIGVDEVSISVPEPASVMLILAGIALRWLGWLRRLRRA